MKTKIFCVHIQMEKNMIFTNFLTVWKQNFNCKTSIEDALEEQGKMEKLLMSLKNIIHQMIIK